MVIETVTMALAMGMGRELLATLQNLVVPLAL
jgi:hypothetical protein